MMDKTLVTYAWAVHGRKLVSLCTRVQLVSTMNLPAGRPEQSRYARMHRVDSLVVVLQQQYSNIRLICEK